MELDLRGVSLSGLWNDQFRKELPKVPEFLPMRAYGNIFRFWVLARQRGSLIDDVRHVELLARDGSTRTEAIRGHYRCAGPRRLGRRLSCICDEGYRRHEPSSCRYCTT